MRILRAQASVELLSIMGISLLVVFMFTALALNSFSDLEAQKNVNDAQNSVQALADAADEVHAQGQGASKVVFVTIPSGTDLGGNSSYIGKPGNAPDSAEPKQITLSYAGNDISAVTKARLTGAFPPSPGSYNMKVHSFGSTVSIQPSLVEIDKAAVSLAMSDDENRTVVLRVFKSGNENVSVSISSNWGHAAVDLGVSPASFYANESGSNVTLVFTGQDTGAAGVYNSNIIILAAGQQSGANETIELPISVSVQGT